jgi:uncharacterized NAD(P)/FAD-binding protein YdhS
VNKVQKRNKSFLKSQLARQEQSDNTEYYHERFITIEIIVYINVALVPKRKQSSYSAHIFVLATTADPQIISTFVEDYNKQLGFFIIKAQLHTCPNTYYVASELIKNKECVWTKQMYGAHKRR